MKPSDVIKHLAWFNELGYGVDLYTMDNVFGRDVKTVADLLREYDPIDYNTIPLGSPASKDHVILQYCLIASILEQDYNL